VPIAPEVLVSIEPGKAPTIEAITPPLAAWVGRSPEALLGCPLPDVFKTVLPALAVVVEEAYASGSFWDDETEDRRSTERLLGSIDRFRCVPMLHLRLADYRDRARAHGVHGTPALVVYYRHRPLFRLVGRTTPAELLHRLQDRGL
jgi:hypothetical protein